MFIITASVSYILKDIFNQVINIDHHSAIQKQNVQPENEVVLIRVQDKNAGFSN